MSRSDELNVVKRVLGKKIACTRADFFTEKGNWLDGKTQWLKISQKSAESRS